MINVPEKKSANAEHLTLKNSLVDPESTIPYWISVCLARSSAESIGVSMRSMVRNAARLAVYDEMMMSVKNHHALPMIRPASDLQSPSIVNVNLNVSHQFVKRITQKPLVR